MTSLKPLPKAECTLIAQPIILEVNAEYLCLLSIIVNFQFNCLNFDFIDFGITLIITGYQIIANHLITQLTVHTFSPSLHRSLVLATAYPAVFRGCGFGFGLILFSK